jgi:hypothetical protein
MSEDPSEEEAPTPPHGTPAPLATSSSRELARRGSRRVAAPPSPAERHERLLLELVERVESRINRRSRG